MTYKWDNKKPTAQMLGRWQPFHDGHYALFKEILKKTGQVCIQIRDVQGVDDNPFDFETVKKNIEDRLNLEFEGRFKIMLVPNITNICYGRGVGYVIEEIQLPKEIHCMAMTSVSSHKNSEIESALVIIRNELPKVMRKACFHEEISQSLGLTNDSHLARPSIFNDNDEFATLTEFDKILIN